MLVSTYISKTITEFWRRWHISLGAWFRDYLYFPLGGSRVASKLRLVFNLSVVWLATGIWHGANWTFILWGVLYGVIIIIEKLFSIPKHVDEHLGIRIPYQIFSAVAVLFGWVLFRAPDLKTAGRYLSAMLGFGATDLFDTDAGFYLMQFAVILVVGILCSTPIFCALENKISKTFRCGTAFCHGLGYTVQALLFLASVSFIVMDAHNPFIYFNF